MACCFVEIGAGATQLRAAHLSRGMQHWPVKVHAQGNRRGGHVRRAPQDSVKALGGRLYINLVAKADRLAWLPSLALRSPHPPLRAQEIPPDAPAKR